jgi:hypothetical protein
MLISYLYHKPFINNPLANRVNTQQFFLNPGTKKTIICWRNYNIRLSEPQSYKISNSLREKIYRTINFSLV